MQTPTHLRSNGSGGGAHEDAYGLPISTSSDRAAELYRKAQEVMLAFGVDPGSYLEEAIAEDPDFALAHAALALVRLRDMRMAEARGSAESAAVLAAQLTPREHRHVDAVVDAVGGRGALAIEKIRAHLDVTPRDALLLSSCVTSLLFSGRQDEMVEVTERVAPAFGDDWYFLGIHAFALEEVRRYDEARRAALRSLDQYPLAGFTVHALAHVYYETGENREAVAFMPGWLQRYDRRAGMHLHLSWHLALFLLANGDYGSVAQLYEQVIRPEAQPGSFQLYDPISLLWRTDAYSGRPAIERWSELASLAAERAAQPGMIFADLHHGMALAALGRDEALDGLLESLRQRGARGNATAGEVALPLLQGMRSFAAGDFEATVQLIEPIEERIYLVGGSKAQREVFHDTLLEALLRTGRFAAAESRLRERLDRRPSPRDFYRLGRVHAGTNPSAARNALSRTLLAWDDGSADHAELAAVRALHGSLAPGLN